MMQKVWFSILWIVVTVVIIALVLMPIYQNCGDKYLFYTSNIVALVAGITFTRYIFLLKYHWFDAVQPIKVALIFVSIPLVLYAIDAHFQFQTYIDENGATAMMTDPSKRGIAKYIETQFVFSWVWGLISSILIPIKMMRSLWRDNKKKNSNGYVKNR